jgi:Tfp pilus assembly protein PilX
MNSCVSPLFRHAARSLKPRNQRGVVLFVALLVMVALSLAGIALIRSSDTATIVAGNLAFKQAANAAIDRCVEQATQALFDPQPNPATSNPVITLTDKANDLPAQNYYACVQGSGGGCIAPGQAIPEVPTVIQTTANFAGAGLNATLVPDDPAGNKCTYVIERMCTSAGPAGAINCNLSSQALGADPGTQHYQGLTRPGGAYYRVTMRVDGPRNTVAYAQSILQ